MPNLDSGVQAALLIGTRDETRLNHSLHFGDGRDALDITTLQTTDSAKEFAYGLLGGAFDSKGFMSDDPAIVNAQLATCSGKNRNSHLIACAPRGFAVGNEANFFKTKSGSFGVDVNVSGITTADPAFTLSDNGVIDGVSLHNPHGSAAVSAAPDLALDDNGGTIESNGGTTNAANLIDGDSGTSCDFPSVDQAVIIDLGDTVPIARVKINHQTLTGENLGGTSAIQVAVSDVADFSSGVTTLDSTTEIADAIYTIEPATRITARYLRVKLAYTTGSIRTVEVYPYIVSDTGARFNIVTENNSDDWIDGGDQSTNGYSAQLNTLELAGSDADTLLSVFVRHTVDDGNGAPNVGAQTTLVTFTAQASKASELLRDLSATVKRWVHCTYTLAGADPEAVFAVSFARH